MRLAAPISLDGRPHAISLVERDWLSAAVLDFG